MSRRKLGLTWDQRLRGDCRADLAPARHLLHHCQQPTMSCAVSSGLSAPAPGRKGYTPPLPCHGCSCRQVLQARPHSEPRLVPGPSLGCRCQGRDGRQQQRRQRCKGSAAADTVGPVHVRNIARQRTPGVVRFEYVYPKFLVAFIRVCV